MRKTISIQKTFYALLLLVSLGGPAFGDRIKMKDGKVYEGRITLEASDIVKIEIPVTASIKETKILGRKDIAEITKDAPDDVAFGKIKPLVPAASLMPASSYRTALKTGPEAFLKNFPDSKHKDEVEKIRKTLAEELDKVERGNIKIEGQWYSPRDQVDFKTLIESRVHLLKMEAGSKRGSYNGLIGAMREYEIIEERYFGTPAFPKALLMAQKIVPTLGRMLQRMIRDVDAANAEWEKNKDQLDEVARAQVEAARAREEKNYQAGLAADKKAGVKWVRLNPRSKTSIEGYLKLASSEMPQLQVYDIAKLEEQAKALVEIDKLIAKGSLALAKIKLDKAADIDIFKPLENSSSSSKRRRKTSSRSRRSSEVKNYIPVLRQKLTTKMEEAARIKKANEDAKASESLTKNLNSTGKKMTGQSDAKVAASDKEKPTEKTEGKSSANAFAALAQASTKKKREEKTSPKSSSSKKPTKKTSSRGSDEKKPRPRPAADTGGGISFSLVVGIATGLLIIVIIVMKVLGIGGQKED